MGGQGGFCVKIRKGLRVIVIHFVFLFVIYNQWVRIPPLKNTLISTVIYTHFLLDPCDDPMIRAAIPVPPEIHCATSEPVREVEDWAGPLFHKKKLQKFHNFWPMAQTKTLEGFFTFQWEDWSCKKVAGKKNRRLMSLVLLYRWSVETWLVETLTPMRFPKADLVWITTRIGCA